MTQLILDLKPGTDTVRGTIRCDGGDTRRFVGYLELFAAVELAHTRATALVDGPAGGANCLPQEAGTGV